MEGDAMLFITPQSIEIGLTDIGGWLYIYSAAGVSWQPLYPLLSAWCTCLHPIPPSSSFNTFLYECFIGRVVLVAKTW